jgi:hypothetical protein
MMANRMKLFPFYDVASNAEEKIADGWTIFQQWTCEHCGAKQTMPDADKFYKLGICEECKKQTNIERAGCNFMATLGIS